ncbi:hypothetical protein [Stenotrophomonas maltophilia]|uniref:phosphorylase family protein n=1 Tax=Stenotrophomonas maltophilia TaxID=40324 RepID=UPI0015DE38DD|nr:hypothetical protein [Stenotrophomonas maltophilia]
MEGETWQSSQGDFRLIDVKIILIDDQIDKASSIVSPLKEHFGDAVEVVHVSNAIDARRRMRECRFDIALIDVNLPESIDSSPTAESGFAMLDMLKVDGKANLPDELIFITAREELKQEATAKAAARGAALHFFRDGDNVWAEVLVGRVGYILERKKRHKSPTVAVAIVTALSSPELDAVLNLDLSWRPYIVPGDPTRYYLGNMQAGSRTIEVVAACAPRKGMPMSAALAAKMAHIFKPKVLAMVGICAGVRGKVALGDIVVADPTWDWGSGKHAQNLDSTPVFRAAPYQSALRSDIASLIQAECRDSTLCSAVSAGWKDKVPGGRLSMHLGPMASGASVLAHDGAIGPIIEEHREVIGVEMEAYAVMAAAELCGTSPLVIKSVCDFADAEKSDGWQQYAAYTSAACLAYLIPKLAEAEIC